MRQVFDLIQLAAPVEEQHPDPRRERHRQGAGGPGHPPSLAPGRWPVRHRQLGLHAGRPAGEQPVRPREGRLHRRRRQQEGAVRAGRRRHDLLRRDRQHPARDPGQAAARDPGARVHAPGRRRDDQGGRADHRRHQRRSRSTRCSRGSSARISSTASTSSSVNLPPLRERSEDIPLLAQHFLEKYARENEKALREISPRAMELLIDYDWPGNVRELENVIERAVVLSTGRGARPSSCSRPRCASAASRRPRRRPAAADAAAQRHLVQGRGQPSTSGRSSSGAAGVRRRPEARRRAAAGQAHDAPRDDEAV